MRLLLSVVGLALLSQPLRAQKPLGRAELIRQLQPQLAGLTAAEQAYYMSFVRPTVGIKDTLVGDTAIAVGQSKIGGKPDLPSRFDWPTYHNEPLAFCGQYNLADASAFDLDSLLPKRGLLSVFIYVDQEGFFNNTGTYRVFYTEHVHELKRTDFPANYCQEGVFRGARLTYFQYYTTPLQFGYRLKNLTKQQRLIFGRLSGAVQDIADSSSGLRHPRMPQFLDYNNHQLLGEERPIQSSVIGYLFNFRSPGKEQLEAAEREYTILLQLDFGSRGNELYKQGEGMAYLLIKHEDLKNKRFDRVVLVFQST